MSERLVNSVVLTQNGAGVRVDIQSLALTSLMNWIMHSMHLLPLILRARPAWSKTISRTVRFLQTERFATSKVPSSVDPQTQPRRKNHTHYIHIIEQTQILPDPLYTIHLTNSFTTIYNPYEISILRWIIVFYRGIFFSSSPTLTSGTEFRQGVS